MNLSSSVWGSLPLELIREILLHIASSVPRRAHDLRLISSDVNILLLRFLFRDVVFTLPEHITRFATIVLPKRRHYIPALKSKLHTSPRPLSSYSVDSLALVVDDRRPSIETALASVGPVFTGITKLAITGQNLSSNAYWLRQHSIHPQYLMILHHGSPHLVNFGEPIFKAVTHLYTSITHGHRFSTVADLPSLTHLAVHARINLSADTAAKVAYSLQTLLVTSPRLECLVLSLNSETLTDSHLEIWDYVLERCFTDRRFILLPYYRLPRMEWNDIVEGKANIWIRAKAWCEIDASGIPERDELREDVLFAVREEREMFPGLKHSREGEWEIDLVQRDDYWPRDENPDASGESEWLSRAR